MKRTYSTGGMLVLAALFVSSTALAGWGRGHGGRGMGGGPGFGPWMAEQLNLTDAQKKQVEQLRTSFLDKTKEAREQLDQDREALRALWQEPNPDKQAIKNLQASMDQLRTQVRDAKVDLHAEMMKILTPEQQTKLNELKQNHPRMGKMGKRGGGGPGMGGPGGPGMMGDCPFQPDNQKD